jgi:hypothetical protein
LLSVPPSPLKEKSMKYFTPPLVVPVALLLVVLVIGFYRSMA